MKREPGRESAPDLTKPQSFIDPVTGAWSCIRCGACCKQIPMYPQLHDLGFDRGDGVCRNLLPDNTCAIYETRPPVCHVSVTVPDGDPHKISVGCALANKLGKVSIERLEAARKYRQSMEAKGA